MMQPAPKRLRTLSTAPVYFTAVSTILGAILFLRFGFAVGNLGLPRVFLLIILGHLITIPTALAISEIATNQRVEGGGEYFIISRSFGLNVGATIGLALYLSQAISVAFYVIAFTEAFAPLFEWIKEKYQVELYRQVISIPALLTLAFVILKKGSNIGIKTLFIVVAILFISLLFFFLGKSSYAETHQVSFFMPGNNNTGYSFFTVFAICFPAFTGMTAGVGLSGDLKNPGRSIPIGTIAATFTGMVTYFFVSYKLAISASPEDLINDQFIMGKIAFAGPVIVPLGLAASTISSAIGSILVAPRTLQALGADRSLPLGKFNRLLARGRGETNEPFNATLLTAIIALVFVALGDVNAVAQIITMFFMVTYGSLCLISFLYHFGADPSYRPVFRSRWYISLAGFLMCLWLMFKISTAYALVSVLIITFLYLFVSHSHKERSGMQEIFQDTIFQLSRQLQVFLQKSKKTTSEHKWRPSAICISESTFERPKALKLMDWISNKYGFGTYIHLILDYYSKSSYNKSKETLARLINLSDEKSKVYMDTLVSPSYTSAIAQIIQLPGISGMENNMMIFEFDKDNPSNLQQIAENIPLVKAGNLDVCIYGTTKRLINYRQGIHVWIRSHDFNNSNLMILLSYIILGHPDWRKGKIKIFDLCREDDMENTRKQLTDLIQTGRLPISPDNVELIKTEEKIHAKTLINSKSADAGLIVTGFLEEQLRNYDELFTGYENVGDVLFINANALREIK
ncbi:MAG: amino acid permease [Bacteroidales bacterium]|nr:amino acid permease [Bacteroidales bacterium]